MAKSLVSIGNIDHGVVVHGCGLDEISPLGPSTIYEVHNIAPDNTPKKYQIKKYKFDPMSLGIKRCKVEDLRGGNAQENAAELRDVLSAGAHSNAKRDAVVLNAGVGVYVYGLTSSIKEGVAFARKVLESGKAITTLDDWISTTKDL